MKTVIGLLVIILSGAGLSISLELKGFEKRSIVESILVGLFSASMVMGVWVLFS